MTKKTIGIIEAILSGVCFGFLGIVAKFAFEAGFTVGENLALRFLVASACLWIFTIAKEGRSAPLKPREAVICLLLGGAGYGLVSASYFHSLQGLSVSIAVLTLYTYPALVSLGSWILFKQKPSNRTLGLMPFMLFGLIMLVWGDMNISNGTSLAFAAGAALLYALYIILSSRLVANLKPLQSACYIQTGAAISLGLFNLNSLRRIECLVTESWLLIVISAILCTVIPMILFLRALKKISASTVSMLSTTEPVTGIVAANFLLDESLNAWQIIGAFILLAVLCLIAHDPMDSKVQTVEPVQAE